MSLSISATMRSVPFATQATGTSRLKPQSAEDEFLDIASKSPVERLRDKILQDMKISQTDLAQMAPEARAAMEAEIQRRTMAALTGSTETAAVVDKAA